ncbi:MAG: DNA mismatch repair endonuclease MutL [Clostridia bacterium]|nr:DNA mismatch repair endonuclease MutL [Clostridia bacterium]
MSKINLLSSKIYNRIAAGEVVERPFSVVKELVENSLDAGATKISIDIVDVGITSIKVTDNGAGIEKSELKKALLPHATSKISKLEDLDAILSLGFRGEALASIASVSKITIESKPCIQDFGASIHSEGGITSEVTDCGASLGTVITVNNLFYNTPVREKFLKSERAEENEVSGIVAKFILGNPNIAFKYTANGKTVYQSFGDGFESAIVCVYGADIIKECFYVDTERNGIKIVGYLGKHHFTKGNRSYQTTFINGRYVVNQTVASAISNAYSSYMMKRQYPFYVLSLTLPSEIVDVNVHPNKLDVRFANNQIVYGSIYSVVSKVLDGTSEALEIITEKQSDMKLNTNTDNNYVTHNNSVGRNNKFESIIFNDKILDLQNNGTNSVDIFAENKAYLEKLERKNKNLKDESVVKQIEQQAVKIDRELNYVGQVLNTYLIFDNGVDVYFVDQHAAHERILFDKLNELLRKREIITQPLLVPFILTVSSNEFAFLYEKIFAFELIGFEISEFGKNAFKISSVPSFLSDINLQRFFNDVLSNVDEFKSVTTNDLLTEKLAQKACKSAIKSGDKLSDLEIKTLKDALKDNLGLKCPHGRPVAVKITRTEIDKWFKRII